MGFTNINYCRSTSTTFPQDDSIITASKRDDMLYDLKNDFDELERVCNNMNNRLTDLEKENLKHTCIIPEVLKEAVSDYFEQERRLKQSIKEQNELIYEGFQEGLEEGAGMIPFDYNEHQFSLVFQCRPEVDHVIFNDPATIVFWSDGTKTVVKCQDDDVYIKETGLALCFMKKLLGNKSGRFNRELRKWCGDGSTEVSD